MTSPTLVAQTPRGWAAMCLDCIGHDGGALDLGEWTTRLEADQAAIDHERDDLTARNKGARCTECGHRLTEAEATRISTQKQAST